LGQLNERLNSIPKGNLVKILELLCVIREGYLLNLSILIRRGKENNNDALSNGE